AEALTSQQMKYVVDTAKSTDADVKALYEAANVGAQGVVPVIFRGTVVALISLQWQQPHVFTETLQDFLTMAAQQVTLTLACL
ncbi:MAG: GAF domain-containing protein, partial [Cyanobacteria bacterium P01_H01_bin.152]